MLDDLLFRIVVLCIFINIIFIFYKWLKKTYIFNWRLWFVGGIIYFYIAPMLLMILYGNYQVPLFPLKYSSEMLELRMPILVFFLYTCFLTNILYFISRNDSKHFIEVNSFNSKDLINRYSNILSFLSIALIFLIMIKIYFSGGISQFFSSYWFNRSEEMFSTLGRIPTLVLLFLLEALVIAVTACFISFNYYKKAIFNSKLICIPNLLFLIACLFFLVSSGNRISIVWALIGFAFYSVKISGIKSLWKLASVALIIALPAALWTFVRGNLLDFATATDNMNNYFDLIDASDLIFFIAISVFEPVGPLVLIHVFNTFGLDNMLFGSSIFGGLLSNLGLTDGNQITNITVVLGQSILNDDATSLPPGMIGELYANFWVVGPILFTFILIVAEITSRDRFNTALNKRLGPSAISVAALASVRFPLVTFIGIFLFLLLIIFIVDRFK